jgi:hypothetical protein
MGMCGCTNGWKRLVIEKVCTDSQARRDQDGWPPSGSWSRSRKLQLIEEVVLTFSQSIAWSVRNSRMVSSELMIPASPFTSMSSCRRPRKWKNSLDLPLPVNIVSIIIASGSGIRSSSINYCHPSRQAKSNCHMPVIFADRPKLSCLRSGQDSIRILSSYLGSRRCDFKST